MLEGWKKVAESLHLRRPPSRWQYYHDAIPEPFRHKARDIAARVDHSLKDYAPWQIALLSALAAVILLQLLRWIASASEDIRERGMPLAGPFCRIWLYTEGAHTRTSQFVTSPSNVDAPQYKPCGSQ